MRIVLLSLVFLCVGVSSAWSQGDVWVAGYFRSNGIYVPGYYRTAPDDTRSDNDWTQSNINPYTGPSGRVLRPRSVRQSDTLFDSLIGARDFGAADREQQILDMRKQERELRQRALVKRQYQKRLKKQRQKAELVRRSEKKRREAEALARARERQQARQQKAFRPGSAKPCRMSPNRPAAC